MYFQSDPSRGKDPELTVADQQVAQRHRYKETVSGGSRISRRGACTRWGRGPPTQVLFGENVCENERIGSHGGGGRAPGTPPSVVYFGSGTPLRRDSLYLSE